jgi:hypothetical protein
MGLRDLRKRLSATVDELEDRRLQERFHGLGLTEIADIVTRQPSRVGGEVIRTRLQPRSGVPAVEITISDGTGNVIAVFTGRRRVTGLEQGRAVLLEGVPFTERGKLMLLNPAYTLLPQH